MTKKKELIKMLIDELIYLQAVPHTFEKIEKIREELTANHN